MIVVGDKIILDRAIPVQMVMGCMRNQTERAMKSNPVTSILCFSFSLWDTAWIPALIVSQYITL